MDRYYIEMVREFLSNPPEKPETDYIRHAHRAVQKILDQTRYPNSEKNHDRDSGA